MRPFPKSVAEMGTLAANPKSYVQESFTRAVEATYCMIIFL